MPKGASKRPILWFEEVKRLAREHPIAPHPTSSYPSIWAREGIGERLARETSGTARPAATGSRA